MFCCLFNIGKYECFVTVLFSIGKYECFVTVCSI